jgi:hypothetical protein
MSRYILAAVLCPALFAPPVFSAPFQPIVGLPPAYQPGGPVAFEVQLPAITDLGSYNIDLVVEGSVGIAGTDFFFDVGATGPASTNYVFPSTANFFDAENIDSPTQHRITLSDFDFVGVNVVPGTNDRVATVWLQTLASYTGSLNIFVDASNVILDTPDEEPTPVQGFAAIQADIQEAGAVPLPVVPEPSSVAIYGLALLVIYHVSSSRSRSIDRGRSESLLGISGPGAAAVQGPVVAGRFQYVACPLSHSGTRSGSYAANANSDIATVALLVTATLLHFFGVASAIAFFPAPNETWQHSPKAECELHNVEPSWDTRSALGCLASLKRHGSEKSFV